MALKDGKALSAQAVSIFETSPDCRKRGTHVCQEAPFLDSRIFNGIFARLAITLNASRGKLQVLQVGPAVFVPKSLMTVFETMTIMMVMMTRHVRWQVPLLRGVFGIHCGSLKVQCLTTT